MTSTVTQDAQIQEGATERLAQFVADLAYEDLPPEVLKSFRRCLLDFLGCTLYGSTLDWSRTVRTVAVSEGAPGTALILGTGETASPTAAALANGTAGHAFEIDDLHEAGCIHPAAVVFPAALALMDAAAPLDPRRFVEAVVAGYEVGCRVGTVLGIAHFFRGFHPQGTVGPLAAAAAAAKMLDLDATRTRHALAIAASQGAGLMAAQSEGMVKRFHSGRAAQSGVYAALLAEGGLEGGRDIIEADFGGFVHALRGSEVNWPALEDGLDSDWQISQVGYKAYASCAVIHPAIALLSDIMAHHKLSSTDIDRVNIEVTTDANLHCGFVPDVFDGVNAQMSFAFAVAVLAVRGETGGAAFTDERLRDPAIADFAKRVNVSSNQEFDARGEASRFSTRVTVHTMTGKVLSDESVHRPGSPERPLTDAQLAAKFRELCTAIPGFTVEDLTQMGDSVLAGDEGWLDHLIARLSGVKQV